MLTQQRLKEVLRYTPRTGEMVWRVTLSNRATAGTAVRGRSLNGYSRVKIDGRLYYAHRLAWLYVVGEWPPVKVDHKNRDRADNRWRNLRLANNSQNSQNTTMRSDNTSGHKGVTWSKRFSCWLAQIQIDGRGKHLGVFEKLKDAVSARREAEKKYFTHV